MSIVYVLAYYRSSTDMTQAYAQRLSAGNMCRREILVFNVPQFIIWRYHCFFNRWVGQMTFACKMIYKHIRTGCRVRRTQRHTHVYMLEHCMHIFSDRPHKIKRCWVSALVKWSLRKYFNLHYEVISHLLSINMLNWNVYKREISPLLHVWQAHCTIANYNFLSIKYITIQSSQGKVSRCADGKIDAEKFILITIRQHWNQGTGRWLNLICFVDVNTCSRSKHNTGLIQMYQ